MLLAIQNMAKFLASFPTTFRCCCLLNRKSGCLKHWMEVWRRKQSAKLSPIYSSIAKLWRHFRGLMKCCLSTVRKNSLQMKPLKKKFKMKIVKQRRRAKRQSEYRSKDVFLSSCLLVVSLRGGERKERIVFFSVKLWAIISMVVSYLTHGDQIKVMTILLRYGL